MTIDAEKPVAALLLVPCRCGLIHLVVSNEGGALQVDLTALDAITFAQNLMGATVALGKSDSASDAHPSQEAPRCH